MTLEIDIVDETNTLTDDNIYTVEQLLQLASAMEDIQDEAELSVVFVNNERIQEINRIYRHKDQPTDVISFALEDEVDGEVNIVGEGMPRVLGDILVSIPKAEEQAQTHGHTFIRELGFLVVHGFLHLLGYDHEVKEEERVMFHRQDMILNKFGLER